MPEASAEGGVELQSIGEVVAVPDITLSVGAKPIEQQIRNAKNNAKNGTKNEKDRHPTQRDLRAATHSISNNESQSAHETDYSSGKFDNQSLSCIL